MTSDECKERFEKTGERCTHELTPQLNGLEGKRIQVTDTFGDKPRRFWVGRSTGWVPCHLEIKTTRSLGGYPAQKAYATLRVIRDRR